MTAIAIEIRLIHWRRHHQGLELIGSSATWVEPGRPLVEIEKTLSLGEGVGAERKSRDRIETLSREFLRFSEVLDAVSLGTASSRRETPTLR